MHTQQQQQSAQAINSSNKVQFSIKI